MGGWQSAALATLAIFLPSFVFVALSHPLLPRMRRSKLFSAFLDGVNKASAAIILTVCVDFGRATITDWRAVVIAVGSAMVVFGFPRVSSAFVIVGGAVLGYCLRQIYARPFHLPAGHRPLRSVVFSIDGVGFFECAIPTPIYH